MDVISVFNNWVNNEILAAPTKLPPQSSCSRRYEFLESLLKAKPRKLFLDVIGKDTNRSMNVRQEGNTKYAALQFLEALVLYNESIAVAPLNSPAMALALGNRAACLINLGYVAEALVDVQRALEIPDIDPSYTDKLTKRRDVCLNRIIETKPEKEIESLPLLGRVGDILECASYKVQLGKTVESGRCLIALEDVKSGEVLAIESPYASVPISTRIYSHCWQCLRRYIGLIECPRCSTAMFCSTDCLKRNEKEHQFECKTFEALACYKMGKNDLLSVKIFIRTVCEGHDLKMLLDNQRSCDEPYRSSDISRIINLVTNTNQRTESDLFLRTLKAYIIVEALDEFSTIFQSHNISKSTAGGFILTLLQNMPCNAHEVTEIDADHNPVEIGSAAYATFSLLNHSCDPNVVRQNVGTSAVLRAIRPITAGQELVDNYGYHFATHTRDVRQSSLLEQYYFTCQCEPCRQDWPDFSNLSATNSLPTFAPDILKKYEESSRKMDVQMELLRKGKVTKESIEWMCGYLDFLDENMERPTEELCKCQEAIKFALNFHPSFVRG